MEYIGNVIKDKYSWLIDRLKAELPGEITWQSFNYDSEFAIAYKIGTHKDAILVERHDYAKYSLNEDPEKEKVVLAVISGWKSPPFFHSSQTVA